MRLVAELLAGEHLHDLERLIPRPRSCPVPVGEGGRSADGMACR